MASLATSRERKIIDPAVQIIICDFFVPALLYVLVAALAEKAEEGSDPFDGIIPFLLAGLLYILKLASQINIANHVLRGAVRTFALTTVTNPLLNPNQRLADNPIALNLSRADSALELTKMMELNIVLVMGIQILQEKNLFTLQILGGLHEGYWLVERALDYKSWQTLHKKQIHSLSFMVGVICAALRITLYPALNALNIPSLFGPGVAYAFYITLFAIVAKIPVKNLPLHTEYSLGLDRLNKSLLKEIYEAVLKMSPEAINSLKQIAQRVFQISKGLGLIPSMLHSYEQFEDDAIIKQLYGELSDDEKRLFSPDSYKSVLASMECRLTDKIPRYSQINSRLYHLFSGDLNDFKGYIKLEQRLAGPAI